MENRSPEPSTTYLQLRDRILNLDPKDLGLEISSSTQVWGILMETGYAEGIATLVAFADGTISLNYSTGGVLLGNPEFPPLAQAAKALIALANDLAEKISSNEEIQIPSVGQVRFTFLTFAGKLTSSAAIKSLQAGDHPLSQLFRSGQEVLAQLNIMKVKKQTR